MSILVQYSSLLICVALLFGLLMAIGIGANDVANAMGTSVGSCAISIRTALIIAAIFEFLGAYFAGGEVTQTIRNGIIDPLLFNDQPDILVFGMLASLLSAGSWLIIASYMGWPVSTTHSIVGAMIGFGLVSVGPEAVAWQTIRGICGSWVVTPVLAGILAYFVFLTIQKLIFNTENPYRNAKRYGPIYIFLAALVILQVTVGKGLKHVGLSISTAESWFIALFFSLLLTTLGYFYLSRDSVDDPNSNCPYSGVERIFSFLMLNTACAMAFAHGSNDVANAIGPVAVIVSLIQGVGDVSQTTPLPWWILSLGGLGIVLGLGLFGYKVIETIGKGITDLSPSRGFVAEFSTASTVVIASGTGLPISTTQTLVGAILGVGFARGIAALNLTVIRNIFASWLVTLPAGAVLSIFFFKVFSVLFINS